MIGCFLRVLDLAKDTNAYHATPLSCIVLVLLESTVQPRDSCKKFVITRSNLKR